MDQIDIVTVGCTPPSSLAGCVEDVTVIAAVLRRRRRCIDRHPSPGPMSQGGQITRRIEVASIAAPDQQRPLPILEVDDQHPSSVRRACSTRSTRSPNGGNPCEGFTSVVVGSHAHIREIQGLVDGPHGIDELVPVADEFLIALLQGNERLGRGLRCSSAPDC